MNQEFYISVTPVRENDFLVRTERVSPGVPLAEELVTWEVEEWLEQSRQLMHDPLLGILRGRQRSLSQSPNGSDTLSPNLVELGQKLYNALFQGTIRDSWMTAQGVAQNRREGLRLRLGLKGDRLPRLPWEVLHAGARPMATGTDVVFSRYQASFAPMATILQPHRSFVVDQNQPLRILMVLAAPTDQEVLELQREANHLREELLRDQGQNSGEIELTILNQPGREQLTQALEQGQYQVLHYAGHSNLSMSGGDLYLVSDRTGLTEVLSGDDLAGLLVNNGIRMAVFNSCRGVYTATADPANETESSNLTDALLKRGIPAVLAMAERIPDDVALTLSRFFYRNLKQRYPIDLSLSRARQGLLSAYGSNQLYWALPILYLHPDFDGYLQPGYTVPQAVVPPKQTGIPVAAFGGMPTVTPHEVADLSDPEAMFSDLDFDDPEDSDRQAVRDLIEELSRDSSDNPFSKNDEQSFFDGSRPRLNAEMDEEALNSASDCIALGEIRAAQGDLAGAIAAYGRALQLDSNSAPAYNKMGIALEELDSPAEAIIAYKMALQLDPQMHEAQKSLQRLEVAHNLKKADDSQFDNLQLEDAQIAPLELPPATIEDENITAPATFAPNERIFGDQQKQAPAKRRPWLAFGILGTALAAVLGIWGFSNWRTIGEPRPKDILPAIDQVTQNPGAAPTTQVGELTASATTSFAQNDLRRGQQAVEKLLDQNAVQAADQALDNVPANQLDAPPISFLKGRLAWQAIQSGNRNFAIDDARRFWLMAVRGERSPQYLNALGFAYYAQGNLKQASGAWTESVKLAREQQKNSGVTDKQLSPAKRDELTAMAGLALVAQRSATAQPAQRSRLNQDAIRLRDAILRQTTGEFQVNALAKNWLWTEGAIGEWRKLLALK